MNPFLGRSIRILVVVGVGIWAGAGCHRDDAGRPASGGSDSLGLAAIPVPHPSVKGLGVVIGQEARSLMGLQVDTLRAAPAPNEAVGFGVVLDPGAFALLENEWTDAAAARDVAEAQAERARRLFATDQNISRRTLETAEAQARTERTRWFASQRRVEAEWGRRMTEISQADRATLVQDWLQRRLALIRVDLLPGENLGVLPRQAKILTLGEAKPSDADFFSEATTVDSKTQSRALLFRVDAPSDALRPGAAIEARFTVAGPARSGWLVPRSAVVRHLGRSWVYLERASDRFERVEISLDRQMDQAWWTSSPLQAGSKLVVFGVAWCLSEELKALAGSTAGGE